MFQDAYKQFDNQLQEFDQFDYKLNKRLFILVKEGDLAALSGVMERRHFDLRDGNSKYILKYAHEYWKKTSNKRYKKILDYCYDIAKILDRVDGHVMLDNAIECYQYDEAIRLLDIVLKNVTPEVFVNTMRHCVRKAVDRDFSEWFEYLIKRAEKESEHLLYLILHMPARIGGMSMLAYACMNQNLNMVKLIIEKFNQLFPALDLGEKISFLKAIVSSRYHERTALEVVFSLDYRKPDNYLEIVMLLINQFSQLMHADKSIKVLAEFLKIAADMIYAVRTCIVANPARQVWLLEKVGEFIEKAPFDENTKLAYWLEFMSGCKDAEQVVSCPAFVDRYITNYKHATEAHMRKMKQIGVIRQRVVAQWLAANSDRHHPLYPLQQYLSVCHYDYSASLFQAVSPGHVLYVVANFIIEQYKKMQTNLITSDQFIGSIEDLMHKHPALKIRVARDVGKFGDVVERIIENVRNPRLLDGSSPGEEKRYTR